MRESGGRCSDPLGGDTVPLSGVVKTSLTLMKSFLSIFRGILINLLLAMIEQSSIMSSREGIDINSQETPPYTLVETTNDLSVIEVLDWQ